VIGTPSDHTAWGAIVYVSFCTGVVASFEVFEIREFEDGPDYAFSQRVFHGPAEPGYQFIPLSDFFDQRLSIALYPILPFILHINRYPNCRGLIERAITKVSRGPITTSTPTITMTTCTTSASCQPGQ